MDEAKKKKLKKKRKGGVWALDPLDQLRQLVEQLVADGDGLKGKTPTKIGYGLCPALQLS